MHSWITSWQGLGLLSRLSIHWKTLKAENASSIQRALASLPTTRDRDDRTLIAFIRNNSSLMTGLNHVAERVGRQGSFPSLMLAVKSDTMAIYTEETCDDFDNLFFIAFVSFGRSILNFRVLHRSYQNTNEQAVYNDMMEDAFQMLEASTRLLLCIITSKAFERHMDSFATANFQDLIPRIDMKRAYEREAFRLIGLPAPGPPGLQEADAQSIKRSLDDPGFTPDDQSGDDSEVCGLLCFKFNAEHYSAKGRHRHDGIHPVGERLLVPVHRKEDLGVLVSKKYGNPSRPPHESAS